jgi:hypothetical protein
MNKPKNSSERVVILREGYVRKGGTNSPTSQVQTRPPAPAPMQPRPAPGPTGPVVGTNQGQNKTSR